MWLVMWQQQHTSSAAASAAASLATTAGSSWGMSHSTRPAAGCTAAYQPRTRPQCMPYRWRTAVTAPPAVLLFEPLAIMVQKKRTNCAKTDPLGTASQVLTS